MRRPRARVALCGRPSEAPALAELRRRLLGDWSTVRPHLRAILAAHGYRSNDTSTVLERRASLPFGTRAAHGTDGGIYLSEAVADDLRAWAAGGRLPRHLEAVRTLIHEELHGVGPDTLAAYVGLGIRVAEVTTELATHQVLEALGLRAAAFSYAEERRALAYVRPFVYHSMETMTAAARRYKGLPAGSVTTADQAMAAFGRSLR